MKKKSKNILRASIIGCLLIISLVGCVIYYYMFAPQFHPDKTVYVYVDQNDNADSVYQKIQKVGNVKQFAGFLKLAKQKNYDQHIHTGRYPIHPKDNIYRVFNRLYKGYQEPLNLTIGNVRTMDKMARSLGRQLMIDSTQIATQLFDSTYQAKMGYNSATIPSLFIPETYQVYWDMSVDELFERLQKEHDHFWNKDRLAKASELGMTPAEVCTLASIVDEETNNNEEKPMVAGLYINRLRADMPLQADPTIKFALNNFDLRRISNDNLRINSPYNTYINTGLPPGPIRVASVKGIDSVLNYTKHDYIYMCAKEDLSGTHNFASNYADHMNNAKKYWKALNDRNIFK